MDIATFIAGAYFTVALLKVLLKVLDKSSKKGKK